MSNRSAEGRRAGRATGRATTEQLEERATKLSIINKKEIKDFE